MRKTRIIEHISLDGVIQAPGGPNEDGDYPYGGWAVPHADPAVGEAAIREIHVISFEPSGPKARSEPQLRQTRSCTSLKHPRCKENEYG